MSPIPAYGDLLGPGRSQQRVAFLPIGTLWVLEGHSMSPIPAYGYPFRSWKVTAHKHLLGPGRSQLVGTLWVLEGHSISPIPAYGDLLGPGRSQLIGTF